MKEKKDKTKKYIPLYFDALFFKVFGEEDKLESLTYLIEETLNIKVKNIEIKNSKLLGQKFKTKRSYLDLLVSLNDDTKLSIEVNTNTSKTTMERNLLFIFKVMVNDIKIDTNYNDLLNYIQINLNHEESKDDYNIEKYVLMEENSHKKLTEKLQIYKINLSFYANKCYTNGEIDKLSEFEKLMGLIGTETQEQYDLFSKEEGMLKEIMRNSDKFRDDSDVVEMYDYETEMKRIYEIEKQNVVKEVSLNRQKEIAVNMLNMNMKVEDISKATGLCIDEIKKLKK